MVYIILYIQYRYEMQLEKFCKFMDFIIDSPPPELVHDLPSLADKMKDTFHKSAFWSRCLQHVVTLGQKDMV